MRPVIDVGTPLIHGGYFFAICVILAQLEIHIEGQHGWAEKLPTWRWQPPWLKRVAARPITGYHVYLTLFMLLLLHLPIVFGGFTWVIESELLSFYFFMVVFWDFLWFVLNRHYGLRRFNGEDIWWYKRWVLRLPLDYFYGLAASLLIFVLPALLGSNVEVVDRLQAWFIVLGELVALTLVTLAIVSRRPTVPTDTDTG
jgi:hypothetical protein